MSNGPVLVELWKDEVKKSSLEKLTKKIIDLIVQLLPIITPLIWNQFTLTENRMLGISETLGREYVSMEQADWK